MKLPTPTTNDRHPLLYRRLSAFYDRAAGIPLIERPRARLFTLADITSDQHVLVVGVGTGLDLVHLPRGVAVVGIDTAPAMLARARARGTEATLRLMDAEALEFDDESFDVVIMSCVLSVVGDPERALAEAHRVLTARGTIWVLWKFCETPPGIGRRLASRVLTFVGGASLTRSLTATIGVTPLGITHHACTSLVDIIRLSPDPPTSERP